MLPPFLEQRIQPGYTVVDDTPSFLFRADGQARSIRASFSREWDHHRIEDRTWGADVALRRERFPSQLDVRPEELLGKVVLDAGCGNGSLANAMTSFGCQVVGLDISTAVRRARSRYSQNESLAFVEGDVSSPPFREASFDVVFSGGVLHHTPDTYGSFRQLAKMVAPGGLLYVWLYKPVPGKVLAVKSQMRRVISRLPGPVGHGIVAGVILPQSMARQYVRELRGVNPPGEQKRWRERLVVLLDSYTPRYRWEHTPEEVHSWYEQIGFERITRTDDGDWGFGTVGRRPGEGRG
jgi:SAM-dependent methyltransferase